MRESNEHILNFLHAMEQLKHECRHSWTSNGRQESVADHSWRLCLMLLVCSPYLAKKFDLLKALKMAIIHDIGEVVVGDKHAFKIISDPKLAKNRSLEEQAAVHDLTKTLGDKGYELFDIWREFEDNKSFEAEIVNFLDKLEVCIQHNEANISSWTNEEIEGIDKYFDNLKSSEPFFNELKNLAYLETREKLGNACRLVDSQNKS